MPACHVAAFVMVIGVPVVPDVIPGPDHKNVGVPDAAVVALNVNVLPLQIGEFDDGLGAEGVFVIVMVVLTSTAGQPFPAGIL